MHTEHVKYFLPDYVRGTLEAEASNLVRQHLESCPACRSEFEEIQGILNSVDTQKEAKPSDAYFTTVLPRVRERLERGQRKTWFPSRVFDQVAIPFVTAILLVGLLINVKIFENGGEAESPLASAVEGLSPEEVIEAVVEETRPTPWVNRQTQEVVQSVVGEHLAKENFLRHSVPAESLGVELPLNNQQLLRELNESEIEQLLQRLGERSSL